jgi:hypothetical protein
MEIRDKVVEFGLFEYLAERRHRLAAVNDLRLDLGFAETTAYSGQVGSFRSAVVPDGVALLAASLLEDEGSAGAWVALRLCHGIGGQTGYRCHGQEKGGNEELHWAGLLLS